MRCDAALCNGVHVVGTNLDFDGLASRAEQHGVQRLIAVRLGNGDEVLEAPIQRLVQRMDDAKRVVAITHLVDDYPETVDVHDIGE